MNTVASFFFLLVAFRLTVEGMKFSFTDKSLRNKTKGMPCALREDTTLNDVNLDNSLCTQSWDHFLMWTVIATGADLRLSS